MLLILQQIEFMFKNYYEFNYYYYHCYGRCKGRLECNYSLVDIICYTYNIFKKNYHC